MNSPLENTILKAAVIGTGKISEEHLRFLAESPHVRLVGVCDLSPAMADFAARRFKADAAYTDHTQMLRDARPDVVHVLTPAATHPLLVRDCLNNSAHVIVEKPVAPTHDEFQSLWELSQSKNRRLIEDHNYRFNQPVLVIEKLVADGTLGEVREVDVRMALSIRAPGGRYADVNLPHSSHKLPCGVLHEFITHLCYLARRFIPTVDRARAAWSKHGGEALFTYDDLDAIVIGGPVHGRIRFTSHTGPETFSLIVRGTRGWAETDLFQPYLRVSIPRGGQQLTGLLNHLAGGGELISAAFAGFRNKIMRHTPYEGLHTFLSRTYEALRNGSEPPVNYADMDGASRLIDLLLDEKNRF
jgi:predicted dehydrogenase